MRKLAAALLIGTLCLCLQPAFAATEQQNKMKTCNADAGKKELQGDARKAFMKDCLSAKPEATASTNLQQNKMKMCNADAGKQKLEGDARKQFMSKCLSAKTEASTKPAK